MTGSQPTPGTLNTIWQTAVGAPVEAGTKPLLQVAVQLWPRKVGGQAKTALGAASGWVAHPAGGARVTTGLPQSTLHVTA